VLRHGAPIESVLLDDSLHNLGLFIVLLPLSFEDFADAPLGFRMYDVDSNRVSLAESLNAVNSLDEVIKLESNPKEDRPVAMTLEVTTASGNLWLGRKLRIFAIGKPDDQILAKLQQKCPDAKILVLGIFPRGADKNDKFRQQNEATNAIVKGYADGKKVFFLDVSDKFLEADGTLPKSIMPDLLHPNEKGYQIWSDAMEAKVKELLK